MNNLLFTALTLALLYCFFYRPSQKPSADRPQQQKNPLPQTETTQKMENLEQQNQTLLKDNQVKEKTIQGLNQSYERLESKKNSEIKILHQKNEDSAKQISDLQTQIRELVKRPVQPTNSKGTQTQDKDLTNTLDTLIKNIQELNNSL